MAARTRCALHRDCRLATGAQNQVLLEDERLVATWADLTSRRHLSYVHVVCDYRKQETVTEIRDTAAVVVVASSVLAEGPNCRTYSSFAPLTVTGLSSVYSPEFRTAQEFGLTPTKTRVPSLSTSVAERATCFTFVCIEPRHVWQTLRQGTQSPSVERLRRAQDRAPGEERRHTSGLSSCGGLSGQLSLLAW
jgi:hypothetical protein